MILCTSHVSQSCYMRRQSHPSSSDDRNNIWWKQQVNKFLSMQSCPASCHIATSSLLHTNILLCKLFSRTLQIQRWSRQSIGNILRCWPSAFVCRVILEILTKVSEESTASIFLKMEKEKGDRSSRILRNVG